MSQKPTHSKKMKEKVFKQMKAKQVAQDVEKNKNNADKPVLRKELLATQQTTDMRTDLALMSVASVADILVKNKLCTYEDFKTGEKDMHKILKFIRKTMAEAYESIGKEIKPEDLGSFVYNKGIASGIDKEVLIHIFGIKPSESRIIKPNQVKIL
jgi:hypothetical protein